MRSGTLRAAVRVVFLGFAAAALGAPAVARAVGLKGDVNVDGVVDVADAAVLAHALSQGEPLGAQQEENADVAPWRASAPIGDGNVDEADLALLHRALGGSDVDADGLPQRVEALLGFSDLSADSDLDGTTDGAEDSDGDGLSNAAEVAEGSDPSGPDTDGDGLGDAEEVAAGTSVLRSDTDEDFYPDGFDDLPTLSLLDQVLVVYNANSTDAQGIAEYYRAARGISPAHVCPVSAPPGVAATADQFLGIRNSILRDCICPLIPVGVRPSPCDASGVDGIAMHSRISHLALVRGMPLWLVDPPAGFGPAQPTFRTDREGISLDFHLARTLYRQDPFSPDKWELTPSFSRYWSWLRRPFPGGFGNRYYGGGQVPPASPSVDRLVAYGRIEALDAERTRMLIDRTLAAERTGVSGKFLNQRFQGSLAINLDDQFDSLTAFGPAGCTSDGGQGTCRAEETGAATVPGAAKLAMDVGVYLGEQPTPAGQAGFSGGGFPGFRNLQRWRKSPTCTPLCRDLATPSLVAECRERSIDYFGELNTDCVGGSPSLIGFQVRSFPVGYFGFHPAGWGSMSGQRGIVTPPRTVTGDAYQDSRFADDSYLRFGSLDSVADPTCATGSGTLTACRERVRANILRSGLPAPTGEQVRVRLRYRNAANASSSDPRLFARISYAGVKSTGGSLAITASVPLAAAASGWQTFDQMFDATGLHDLPLKPFELEIFTSNDVFGFLELDGVEVLDVAADLHLLAAATGSFAAGPPEQTAMGDWAAVAIDRLGALAWWGSQGHADQNGFSFWGINGPTGIVNALFGGRTLGEAILHDGSGSAGAFFGDPLYRPSAAKIFLGDGDEILGNADQPHPVLAAEPPLRLYVNALHGVDGSSSTRWSVSACRGGDPVACEADGAWVELDRGVGPAHARPLEFDADSFVSDPEVAEDVVLGLRVWNPGREDLALHDFAHLRYLPVPEVLQTSSARVAWAPGETTPTSGTCTRGIGDVELTSSGIAQPVTTACSFDGTWQADLEFTVPGEVSVLTRQQQPGGSPGESSRVYDVSTAWFADYHLGAVRVAFAIPPGHAGPVHGLCWDGATVALTGDFAESPLSVPCESGAFEAYVTANSASQDGAVHAEQRDPTNLVVGEHDVTIFPGVAIDQATASGAPTAWSVSVEGTCPGTADVFVALIESASSVFVPCTAGQFASSFGPLSITSAATVFVSQNQDRLCIEDDPFCWSGHTASVQPPSE